MKTGAAPSIELPVGHQGPEERERLDMGELIRSNYVAIPQDQQDFFVLTLRGFRYLFPSAPCVSAHSDKSRSTIL